MIRCSKDTGLRDNGPPDRMGDRRWPVWITEIGWATDGPEGYLLVTSEESQASRLSSTFQMLRQNRKRFKIGTVHWFRRRDTATYAENTNIWPDYAGLYRNNGAPKPSCGRFRRVTGAPGGCQRIPATSSASALPMQGTEQRAQAQLIPSPPE